MAEKNGARANAQFRKCWRDDNRQWLITVLGKEVLDSVVLRAAEHSCCSESGNPNVRGMHRSFRNQRTVFCIGRFGEAPFQQLPFALVAGEPGRDLERGARFREAAE